MTMQAQAFDESQHPRGAGGQFTTKPAGEADAQLQDDPAARAHQEAGGYTDSRSAHAAATRATDLGLYAAVTTRSEYPDQDAGVASYVDFDVVVMDTEGDVADYLEAESLDPADADNASSTEPYVDPDNGTRTEYHARLLRPATPLNTPAPRMAIPADRVDKGQLIEVNGLPQRVTRVLHAQDRTVAMTGTDAHRFENDDPVTVLADEEFLRAQSVAAHGRAQEALAVQEQAMRRTVDGAVSSMAMDARIAYPQAKILHIESQLGEGPAISVYDEHGTDLLSQDLEADPERYDQIYDDLGESASMLPMERGSLLEPHAAGHDPTAISGWGYSGDIEVDKHTGQVTSLKVDIDAAITRSTGQRP